MRSIYIWTTRLTLAIALVGILPVPNNSSIVLAQSKKAKAKLLREINKDTHIMTDKEVANSVDLEVSDFCDDGADIDELRDIMGGRKK